MPELLRGRPALKANWIVSVGLDLLGTTSLVMVVHDFEGLGGWLLEAYAALPPRLRRDLDLALRSTNYPQAIVETVAAQTLGEGRAGHTDVQAFFADLAALDAATCRHMLEMILAKSIARHELSVDQSPAQLLDDQEALEAVIKQLNTPLDAADAAQLFRVPTEWRDLLLNGLQRFWERLYQARWQETYNQLVRNVEYHRHQQYPMDFDGIFTAVTGRQVPDRARPRISEIEQVRFVPSLYLGPYVSFLFDGPTATIFYNGGGTPVPEDVAAPQIEELYNPLTALADKTRLAILAMLNGRELYAQEIVDRLGISQSAVSRHLQLMVDVKVLNVRRGERGAKYYSINTAELQQVARRLSEFQS
jgi:DNA-binding transcriptional ArsR family regulator